MCEERGIGTDENAFEKLMEEQRARAREAGKFKATLDEWTEISAGPDSKFVGYDVFRTESKIRRFSLNEQGQLQFILDVTPFYAESGGQVGDHGTFEQNGKKWNVVDVQKQGESIIHFCEKQSSEVKNTSPESSPEFTPDDSTADCGG